MTEDSFGRRLRRERERRQISLSSISANTKIGIALFEGLERDDVSRWPAGIFRRAFIRAYAEAIGVDVAATVQEFLERFPDPITGGEAAGAPQRSETTAAAEPLRLTLAVGPRFGDAAGRIDAQRVTAALCDLGLVTALSLSISIVAGSFWMPLSISLACYFSIATALFGTTPGMLLRSRASSNAAAIRFGQRHGETTAKSAAVQTVARPADGAVAGAQSVAARPSSVRVAVRLVRGRRQSDDRDEEPAEATTSTGRSASDLHAVADPPVARRSNSAS
jgi:transcriptional regulator with XRE-family HTH domain